MGKTKAFLAAFLAIALISACTLTARASAEADKGAAAGLAALDRFEATVRSLKLTEDQTPKIDKYFAAARADTKALADIADAAEREKKSRAISSKLRSQIGEVLTNPQKAELIKKMPPPVDTDAMIDRIKRDLNKPGSKLTEDQKTRVNAVLDDTKKKLDDIMANAKETQVDPAPKVQEVLKDMKVKLTEILSPTAGK
ncbi:MAG TPA: hypothetical protein VFE47_29485 [Tepidisphaeraceae bacterium]|jgi:Spy/CpxP family protein refolding chaperone|nr:hypothetical protein [Tepidisphaeraceae bacterium]